MNFWLNIYSVFLFTALLTASVRANSFSEGFSSREQRHLFSDFDYDTSENLGVYLSEFFHDSQSQLVVDLDLVREIWSELARYREATLEGDVDYIQSVIDYLEPLQNYDISAPCLADLFHFFWTTYNYAKTTKAAMACMDCNCTRGLRNAFNRPKTLPLFTQNVSVVDSIGKVPAALVSGNNLWTGSWHTCRKVSVRKNRQGQRWNGQYCMAHFQPYNRHNPLKAFAAAEVDPTESCRQNVSRTFEEWSEEDRKCFDLLPLLNLGLCLPDQCTNYDTERIIQFLYNAAEMSMDRKLVCKVEVECSNSRPDTQLWNNTFSVVVLCFIVFVFGLMLFGSCYDVYVARPLERIEWKPKTRRGGGGSDTSRNHRHPSLSPLLLLKHPKPEKAVPKKGEEEENAEGDEEVVDDKRSGRSVGKHPSVDIQPSGLFVTLIMMFSVPRNIEYIMSTTREDGQIRCLHGLRFVSMSWVIFGHTYYYICTSLTTDNLLQTLHEFPKFFYNQLVVQAPLAVDSFFFLSGLLTAYIFLLKLGRNQIRLASFATWFAYFFRRYLRLTPVYVVIMVLEVSLFTYTSDGPFWRPIERNYCRNSWWTNLLYMNNFLRQDDPCMGWTWYLANDFQLYAFAPILIVLLHKLRLGGVLFAALILCVSAAINLLVTVQNHYPPAPLLTSKLQILVVLQSYWVDLYVKPYIRCGPYIIGCLIGYVLVERKKRPFTLSTVQWVVGWAVCAALGLYSIFGLYHYTKTGDISEWWAMLYTVSGRPAFAVALAWVTFACEIDHETTMNAILGHKMFIPLSKLTFCAYLVHPILLQLYYLSRPNAFHFTHSFQLLHMFFAMVVISYAAALLFSLAFEMPVLYLDKLLFGGREAAAGLRQPKVKNGQSDCTIVIENGNSERVVNRDDDEELSSPIKPTTDEVVLKAEKKRIYDVR